MRWGMWAAVSDGPPALVLPPLPGGKYGATVAGYFPLGFGSELAREAPHRQLAGQGGWMAAVETPFS